MNNFKNKKVVIMGLGAYESGSGISAAIFLARCGANILVTDLRKKDELKKQLEKLEKFENIKYILGEHREKDFKNTDFIIKNPAVPKDSKFLKIARKNKIRIHNDWTIFMEEKENEIIAVTGTRGKSTTVTIIDEFLKTRYKTHLCGNIGVSPLAIFSKIKKDDIVVAELSSWILADFKSVKKSPHIAVVTNLMPDHLNKYKSLKDYYDDKKNIFKFQKKEDILILNKDEKETKKLAKITKSKLFWFSEKKLLKKENGAFLEGDDIYFQINRNLKKIADIKNRKIQGEHNKQNILAACTVAILKGVKKSEIQNIINNFSGVSDRLEFLRELNGVKFYNDTTATSPDAAIVALKTLGSEKKNIILLAGGSDKKLDYKNFVKEVKKNTKGVILFSGDATEKIKKEFKKIKYENILGEVSNMKDALRIAIENTKNKDIVLLSPGAASFGVFKNEFDRGEQFCDFVSKIKG
jgi:UDP-N-acetylmuramoylalanine--D-glutamate ligase